ncbi:MAG TPA: hypothetical protein P5032_17520, partial [Candidatus Competibacter sp.]|nr:hypothetical protein [Candidatus Competibacter sp.]
ALNPNFFKKNLLIIRDPTHRLSQLEDQTHPVWHCPLSCISQDSPLTTKTSEAMIHFLASNLILKRLATL